MELVADLGCRNQDLMRNQDILGRWLLEMCKVIGMTPFGEPRIQAYPLPDQADTALSATLFIGESDIRVHTYPEFGRAFINIFSCEEFDMSAAMDFIRSTFDTTDESVIVLDRGVDRRTGKLVPLGIRYPKQSKTR